MKKLFIPVMAVLFAFASCNDREVVELPQPDVVPDSVSSESLVLYPFVEGLDAMERNWRDGNTLGVYLTEGSLRLPYRADSASYTNLKARFFSDTWFFDRDVHLTGDPAVVYAYSPYVKGVNPEAVRLECTSGTDYMYGTHFPGQTHVSKGSNKAMLLMRHALSLVQVYVRRAADVPPISVDRIEIRPSDPSGDGLPVEATLDIRSGRTVHTAFGSYSQNVHGWTLEDEFRDSVRRDVPVIPQTIGSGQVQLVVTLGGREYARTIPSATWNRAYRYVYRFTYNGDGLQLLEPEIRPWEKHDGLIIDIVGN